MLRSVDLNPVIAGVQGQPLALCHAGDVGDVADHIGRIGQCSGDVGGIEIGIKTTSTTGTPRLDMNSGALLAADSETANALKFPNGVNGVQLTVDHGILEAGANIYTETVPGIPYVGNRHLLVTGDAMAILYLTTDNAYWIAEQSGSAITFDYRAYVRALLPHVGT